MVGGEPSYHFATPPPLAERLAKNIPKRNENALKVAKINRKGTKIVKNV